jgi:Protein phosphatase 2C
VSWKAAVCSEIGTRHCHQDLPCQDYGQYVKVGSVLIGAVSDGAGSARHAEVGAKIAVETALSHLQSQVALFGAVKSVRPEEIKIPRLEDGGRNRLPQLSETEANRLFTATVMAVVAALQNQADSEGYDLADLACTLLVFVASPDLLAAMQIGDGFIVVETAEVELELLFRPSKGEYINETCFVTSSNALDHMQVRVCSERPQFICAATDGLEKVAIRFQDWLPFSPFFQPLVACLQSSPAEATAYLQSFLSSERLNARTDDDKTLLLGLYDQESQSHETAQN